MIARKLRQLYTTCSVAIAYPEPSGSTYIMRKPVVCFGPSLASMMTQQDRKAMQQNLTDKYGIRQIEENDE